MSLHSSFHDYHGYQQTNLFFDSLKTTPPQRLKYFFVPEMDYSGYLHVVRDQEDKAFRKEFRQNQFTACRHENIQKNRERHERRAGFEAALKPGATPQPDVPDQSLTVPGKPYRTTTQRWSDRRKRKMERRAISMIENRMAQETAELQMFEGWRAASQGCIRDKFRDTVSNNRVVEERLRLPHTQLDLRGTSNLMQRTGSSLGFTQTGKVKQQDLQSTLGATQQSAIQDMKESMDNIASADNQVAAITTPIQTQETGAPSTPMMESPVRSPLASPGSMYDTTASDLFEAAASPVAKYCLPISPRKGARKDLDEFENKLLGRQVSTNQRLRSLSLDATKTWTRPASDPLHVPSPH